LRQSLPNQIVLYNNLLSELEEDEMGAKMRIKSVLFDFGDTLVQESPQYSVDACLSRLLKTLARNGISVSLKDCRRAYDATYERILARHSLREVVYTVVVSRTLGLCGYSLEPTDQRVVEGAEAFMECWMQARTMERSVPSVLRRLRRRYKLGVVSNHTFSPAVSRTLMRFGVVELFDAIVVSADVGWRKPSPRIFRKALRTMRILASETVYVGDELDHDVEGAMKVGLHTVLLKRPSTNMAASNVKPDIIVHEWKELPNAVKALERF
jgi:HAD superfamily hydrolase (TIGR01662 family)